MSLFDRVSLPGASKPADGAASSSGGLFGSGAQPAAAAPTGTGLFGSTPAAATTPGTSGSLFAQAGNSTNTAPTGTGLFGSANNNTATTSGSTGAGLFGSAAPASTTPSAGGLFGGAAPKPAGTGLFGSSTTNNASSTPAASSSLFGGNTQNNTTGGTGLFGAATANNNQQQGNTGLFGSSTTNTNNQQGNTGGDMFAHLNKPAGLGGFGATTNNNNTGLFGNANQQQQQQQQGPSLSTFGDKALGATTQQNTNNTVQGVKIDISDLVPTTKFDACNPELQNEIEKIDNMIQNQIKMCNEVSDLFPSITAQINPIPTDVEYVENRLETLQEALELDAAGIEACRNTVETDAAEAKLAFRTIDTMLLPLQYQTAPGDRWWSTNNTQRAGHSLRSALGARHTLLALPKDAEEDPSDRNGNMPANLVEYVSSRAENMAQSVDWYKQRLTDIELHVRDLEVSLTRQLNDAVARSRVGKNAAAMGYDPAQSQVAELAGALEDIEGAILSVAGRVGETKDQVNEMTLGPVAATLW